MFRIKGCLLMVVGVKLVVVFVFMEMVVLWDVFKEVEEVVVEIVFG